MYMGIIPGPRDFLRYVYELRYFIGLVVAIFVLCMALGYAVSVYDPSLIDTLLSGLQQKAQELSARSQLGMALGIFENNALGCLLAMGLGLFAGVYPAIFIASNGLIIGVALGLVISKYGLALGLLVFILGLLPHGVFELSIVFIAAAAGMKLGYDAIRSLVKWDPQFILKSAREAVLMYVFWVLPILLVAAFLEVFVTGAILNYVAHA